MLKLQGGQSAVLRVPKNLSEQQIAEFLESKSAWLERNSKKLQQQQLFANSFDFAQFAYLDGKKVGALKDILPHFDGQLESKKKKATRAFYLSHFEDIVRLAKEISQRTGLSFSEIVPINSVRVWGSFNSQKVMKLNWKLVLLPKHLTEYVICHELCHGLQMNHQPKFWSLVGKICPNFKAHKTELSNFSFLLKQDFC